jgi:hypothetical protein
MLLGPNEGRFQTPGLLRRPVELSQFTKFGKQTQFPNVWQVSLGNAEPAVATCVVSSYCLLKSMKKY